MSTRERWIVYPLLFLTLGIVLRDKFMPLKHLAAVQLQAGEIAVAKIQCNQLEVNELICRNQLEVNQLICHRQLEANEVACKRLKAVQSECRALLVRGPNGRPVVVAEADSNTQAGTVETFSANGVPQVRLFSTDAGGVVTTIGHLGRVAVALGHVGPGSGVIAQSPELGSVLLLSAPWRFETKPAPPETPEGQPAAGKTPEKQPPKESRKKEPNKP